MTRLVCINLLAALIIVPLSTRAAELQEVASFPDQQVTGVGVSQKSGRVFVNFPYWADDHLLSVAEIVDGQPKPFPDEEWNKPGPAGSHFICVQSVVVDDQDNLWIIDPAAPKMKEIVGQTPAPNGMLEAPDGSVYLTDIEDGAVVRWNPSASKVEPVIADKRLLWPDTLSWGPGGDLYVTASQIESMARFNGGTTTRTEPYHLFKITGIQATTPRRGDGAPIES